MILREPRNNHILGNAPQLPHAGTGDVHLGNVGGECAVRPLLELDHVVGEDAPRPKFGYARRERDNAGRKTALPISVSAVGPTAAKQVRLRFHDYVDQLPGKPAEQLLHDDDPVVKPRHAEHVGRRVC